MYLGAVFYICLIDERDMLFGMTMIEITIILALIGQKESINFLTSILLILFVYLVYFVYIGYVGITAYKNFIQNEDSGA